jgi:UDP-N-acetyl-D-mannosaminuronic acid dehydrogenase
MVRPSRESNPFENTMQTLVPLAALTEKLALRTAKIAVVGLGYVGLPLACAIADAGFTVTGVDIKADRVSLINDGRSPIEGNEPGLAELLTKVVQERRLSATVDFSTLASADIVFINVDTPVEADHRPRYSALRSACEQVGAVMKDGALVIVESTIAPGTMADIVQPLLERVSGKKLNVDFFLGHCPERVMPGKLLANLRNLSRVCGGSTPVVAVTMVALYSTIVRAELTATDCVTAELVKTAENAYRDVNIAFANELALICESSGADFMVVRELINKSPGRNVLFAGAGVGGHCIPKDSWLLAYGARDKADIKLLAAARHVNDAMPAHMLKLTVEALREAGRDIRGSKIAVLGWAYLEDTDDTRNSPSNTFAAAARELGAEIVAHDPFVPELQGDLLATLEGANAAVVMVGHSLYRRLSLRDVHARLATPVLVDGRFLFDPEAARAAGLVFRGVGRGRVR